MLKGKSPRKSLSSPKTAKKSGQITHPNNHSNKSIKTKLSTKLENPQNILFSWFSFLQSQNSAHLAIIFTLILSFYLRWTVGLGSFSGEKTPPMHGDYEAQRHWMEITFHLPSNQWYFYDLKYWGLDYPPLTAFHSYLCGFVANLINPKWVELDASRGFESYESKLFMRATVILFDFLVYIPGVILFLNKYLHSAKWTSKQAAIFIPLIQPALILIDNGHFQISNLVKIGSSVLITSAIMLSPWISSTEQLYQIAFRVFPFARGLFEDKVANLWCVLSVVVKLKNIFSVDQLAKMAAGFTALAFLPSNLFMVFYLLKTKESHEKKVHEKSILLAVLPISLLFVDEVFPCSIFVQVSIFSMYPLLQRDNLELQYFATLGMWIFITSLFPFSYMGSYGYLKVITSAVVSFFILLWHIAFKVITPPSNLPHIFELSNATFSFGVFCLFYFYFSYRTIQLFWPPSTSASKIKTN
ncbi:hypothetical protein BB560_000996 [Smittium megazygosporum]|uniref:Alpha-1,3-glucosyltransferase n=1 Tax=Smittium megazygosporum TaxID=133381 RepID=A0A2T9ZIT9_9FUNG|nr:hypothetical protein BB560_000996 [Smittium megazygosporum]